VRFTLDGRPLRGVAGESIAAALLRAGERTLSYSVKFHRPRSIYCGRGRCTMCHVEVDGTPGVRACITPLSEGMDIRRQDFRPFFAPLLTAAIRLLPFPAGFYFRFFSRPMLLRRMFLGTLRRMAGVGRVPSGVPSRPTPPAVSRALSRLGGKYEVAVVGAGMSGMRVALSAAEAGARVLMVDEYPAPGGHSRGAVEDPALAAERDRLAAALDHPRITLLTGCSAFGLYPGGTLLLGPLLPGPEGTAGYRQVRARTIVIAAGANDVVPLFDNNDLPGVFGARGLRLFLERDGIVPGRRAAVWGTAGECARAVAMLRAHGIAVKAVLYVDGGADVDDARVLRRARVVSAGGGGWLGRVRFETLDGEAGDVECDLLCVAMPGQPAPELSQQAGFGFALGPDEATAVDTRVMVPTANSIDANGTRCVLVGEAAGVRAWRDKLEMATAAGRAAAEARP
jgi:sarcosine oxidase subunit alpha